MQTHVRHRVRDMFVATNTGLYHGHVDGPTAELSPIGLEGQGTVLSVAIDVRDANIVYAATRRGGFFRSDDHGRTWHEKNTGILYKEAWTIAQHPATGTLYLGTEPAAIFVSNDRGEQWTFCEGNPRAAGNDRVDVPAPAAPRARQGHRALAVRSERHSRRARGRVLRSFAGWRRNVDDAEIGGVDRRAHDYRDAR